MCGIAGWLTCGAGAASLAAHVRSMAERIAHRGPDDRGIHVDEAAGLGLAHTRLAIIDLSAAGHQPMRDATGRFTIVYNGEVYNYRALRAELQDAGVTFRGRSDTEVVLELFARQGEAMLPRLNGIFALAIWDRQERSLFLARDALGVKPLYYTEHAGGFAFASELKALLPLLRSRTLDPISLHRYLAFLWCPGEGTPIREVRRLPPGEAMWVREGRIVRRLRWYELPARRRSASGPLSAADAVEAVRSGMRRAVHRQLVADVPVGAFLSGGLDSSAVVALAREQAPDIRCFTIELAGGQDAGFADDLPYARRTAERLGVRLEVITVDAAEMARDLDQMMWRLDEPLADPAPLNVLYISRLAREHGVPVLLSGAGGDDLFTGYRRHLALRYEGLWSWLPAAFRRALARAGRIVGAGTAVGRRLQRLGPVADSNGDERLAAYLAWARESSLRSLYSPPFAAEVDGARADAPLLDFLAGVSRDLSPLERLLSLEQRFFLADHNLLYTDKMSMAVGVEVRVPYLDLELVELAARIPEDLKQRGRTGKWVLKQAMAPYLPDEVIRRPKTGFGAPLRRWLRFELRGLVDDLLSPAAVRRRGIFDPAAVGRFVAADRAGRVDAAYTIFAVMAIELWCRAFLDAGPGRSGP